MDARRFLPLPVLALATAIAADRLLWDAPLGLGAAVLAAAVAAVLLWRGRTPGPAWGLAALAAALLAIDPGPLAALLALLALAIAALVARGWTPTAPAAAAGAALAAVPRALGRSLRDLGILRRRPGCGARHLAAWSLPVLGAGVFLVIFAIANPVIGARLGDAWEWLLDLDLPLPTRVLLWWTAAAGIWLLARVRARKAAARAPATVREPAIDRTVRCLAAFNLAFLVQNGCDAAYLWSGASLPDGMTYAAYAHRGAYPLVVAALLAGAFVLATVRPGGAAERSRMARILVGAFLVQTVILTASAWWRLDLYIDVYGLTRWRLASLAWMGLVGFGLAAIAWRIAARRSGRWLVETNAWACGLVLLAFALGDGDGLIARHNVDRALAATAAVPLDLDYCASLGPAALPALERFARTRNDIGRGERQAAVQAVAALRTALFRDLGDWRGHTMRRWLVRAELSAGR